VCSDSTGNPRAPRTSLRITSGGRSVMSGPVQRVEIAELPSLPTRLTLATDASGTRVVLGFAKPVSVRMLDGSPRPGTELLADSIELWSRLGARTGFSHVRFKGHGIGTVELNHLEVRPARTTKAAGR